MFHVRSSKFRHLYGSPSKKESWYEGIKVTTNAHDSNFCEVNPKFLAIVIESTGGGVFLVLPINQTGKLVGSFGRVCGHRGSVTDIKWNPFDDNIIASCSDDATIKLWSIPDKGITVPLTQSLIEMRGHFKKVGHIEWHPVASDILLSAGLDFKVIVWNCKTGEAARVISVHGDAVFSISWSPDGCFFASTCKDKTIRVIDPRNGSVLVQGEGHLGTKCSKIVFVGKNRLFTTGFSRMSERQFALWNTEDMSKPLKAENVDCSSGILIPYFDHDTKIMFLAGKGDGNIRFYEISDSHPHVQFLNQFQSNLPQRGLGQMPKRGCEVKRCEIVRFYKLHTTKEAVEPISMIVPRKSEVFHGDVFPPTNSYVSCLTAEEWLSGIDRQPDKVSLQFEAAPVFSTKRGLVDTIPEEQKDHLPNIGEKVVLRKGGGTSTGPTPGRASCFVKIPDSLKNIHRLSTSEDFVCNIGGMAPRETKKTPDSFTSGFYSAGRTWGSRIALTETSPQENEDSNEQKKMELRKTFHNQQEEIRSLKNLLHQKDQRIQDLEDQVKRLKAAFRMNEPSSLAAMVRNGV